LRPAISKKTLNEGNEIQPRPLRANRRPARDLNYNIPSIQHFHAILATYSASGQT